METTDESTGRIEPMVGARLSPEEVKRLAFEKQYTLLYKICEIYEHRHSMESDITWQEAMQMAAIEQAKMCDRLTKELMRVISLSSVPIKLNL